MQPLIRIKRIVLRGIKNSVVVFSILFIALFSVSYGATFLQSANVPEEFRYLLIQPVSAQEIEEDFLCPCCGLEVADCECGMAVERRAFIEDLVDDNEDKLSIYSKYANEYDLSEFKDENLSVIIQSYLEYSAPSDRPTISINADSKDLGELIQADYPEGERLEMEFYVKNEGNKDLIINEMTSSCICTKGQLIIADQVSPEVGMDHSEKVIPDWEVIIPPGETATLKVFYDPNAHGEFSGDITRTVTLNSNDPINSKVSVRFELTQI